MRITELLTEDQLEEINWKKGLSTAALATGALIGSASNSNAAQSWSANSPAWSQSGLPDHVKSDTEITKTNNVKNIDKQMSSVQGPNINGEYKVTIVTRQNGKKNIQTYTTKNPPNELLTKK